MAGKVRLIVRGRKSAGRKGGRFGPGTSRALAKTLFPTTWNEVHETSNGYRRKHYSWNTGHRPNPRPKKKSSGS